MSYPEVLAAIPFLFVLLIAGAYDWERRKIPDIFLSLLWIALMFVSGAPLWAAGTFGIVFFANTVYISLKGKPILAWGDLLAVPPTLGVMFTAAGFFWSMMCLVLTFGAIIIYFALKREVPKNDPIVTYVAIACFLAFLPQLL